MLLTLFGWGVYSGIVDSGKPYLIMIDSIGARRVFLKTPEPETMAESLTSSYSPEDIKKGHILFMLQEEKTTIEFSFSKGDITGGTICLHNMQCAPSYFWENDDKTMVVILAIDNERNANGSIQGYGVAWDLTDPKERKDADLFYEAAVAIMEEKDLME